MARLKRADRNLVAGYARMAGIPWAMRRRQVDLMITLGPRQRGADPDAYWKSLNDALVKAHMLVDDSRQWVRLGPVEFERGPERSTMITLRDLS